VRQSAQKPRCSLLPKLRKRKSSVQELGTLDDEGTEETSQNNPQTKRRKQALGEGKARRKINRKRIINREEKINRFDLKSDGQMLTHGDRDWKKKEASGKVCMIISYRKWRIYRTTEEGRALESAKVIIIEDSIGDQREGRGRA